MASAVRANAFKGGVPKLVIGGALLRILQSLVRFIHLFEVDFRCVTSRISIRVKFLRKLTESAFDLVVGCALLQSEHFVIVALHVPFFRFLMRKMLSNRRKPAPRSAIMGSGALAECFSAHAPNEKGELSALLALCRPFFAFVVFDFLELRVHDTVSSGR